MLEWETPQGPAGSVNDYEVGSEGKEHKFQRRRFNQNRHRGDSGCGVGWDISKVGMVKKGMRTFEALAQPKLPMVCQGPLPHGECGEAQFEERQKRGQREPLLISEVVYLGDDLSSSW